MIENDTDFIFPVYIGKPTEKQPKSLISYHIMQNGMFCKQNILNDKYIFYKADKISDLELGVENLNVLGDDKIPISLLYRIVDFFRHVIKHFNKNLEAYIIIAKNKLTSSYFLYVPNQEVQSVHVDYDLTEFYSIHKDSYIVADVHCHGAGDSFFSADDNKDDNRNRFSIVIGKIDSIFPKMKCRLSYGNKFADINENDIFDTNNTGYSINIDFEKEMDKIQIKTFDIPIASKDFWDTKSYYTSDNLKKLDNRSNNDLCDMCNKKRNGNYVVKNYYPQLYQKSFLSLCKRCYKEYMEEHDMINTMIPEKLVDKMLQSDEHLFSKRWDNI